MEKTGNLEKSPPPSKKGRTLILGPVDKDKDKDKELRFKQRFGALAASRQAHNKMPCAKRVVLNSQVFIASGKGFAKVYDPKDASPATASWTLSLLAEGLVWKREIIPKL